MTEQLGLNSAETGEVIATKKSWWAFLASEPTETEETAE